MKKMTSGNNSRWSVCANYVALLALATTILFASLPAWATWTVTVDGSTPEVSDGHWTIKLNNKKSAAFVSTDGATTLLDMTTLNADLAAEGKTYRCTEIAGSGFRGQNVAVLKTGLTELRLPDEVTSIGQDSFHGCSALTSVMLGTGFNKFASTHGFSQCGAPGSASDYFNDMSRGQFKLVFDVIGPVKVSKASTYYGGPSVYFGGTDHVGEFIAEAVTKADSLYKPDWSRYDWDGDGELEQVFVLYAGYGQATGGDTGLLWPCKWTLDEAKVNDDGPGGFSLGGTYINTFACGNELYGNSGKTYMGMGVFCHEFSHCLGLPDMYDTAYGATPTMGNWDLMAHGSYNGPQGIGWCPAGWTSYERAQAGWLDVKELQPGGSVRGMTSLDEGGEAYAIYNDDQRNEYYLLENHKHVGWDAYTPEQGLLIVHIDYDSTLFANNIVNTTGTFTTAEGYDGNFTNDHARMQALQA